jgi:hypothetical protein
MTMIKLHEQNQEEVNKSKNITQSDSINIALHHKNINVVTYH